MQRVTRLLRPLLSGAPGCSVPGLGAVPHRGFSGKKLNLPPSAEEVARPAGVGTMMRLPYQETPEGLDAAFIGVPLDTGTSNRPGARQDTPQTTDTERVPSTYTGTATQGAPNYTATDRVPLATTYSASRGFPLSILRGQPWVSYTATDWVPPSYTDRVPSANTDTEIATQGAPLPILLPRKPSSYSGT